MMEMVKDPHLLKHRETLEDAKRWKGIVKSSGRGNSNVKFI